MKSSPDKLICVKKASFVKDAFKVFGKMDKSYLKALIIALDFIIKYKDDQIDLADLNSYKYNGYFYISIFKEGD